MSDNCENSPNPSPAPLDRDADVGIDRRGFLISAALGAPALALGACAVPGAPAAGAKNAPAPVATESQKAMAELNALIARINREYLNATGLIRSPQDIADGQRFIMHLLGVASDLYLEGDPVRPRFVSIVSPERKILGDNPDAKYHFTLIDAERYYRIRGRRKGNEYISYTVHADKGGGDWNGIGIAHINHRDIRFEPDGRYEIIVGPTRRGKNSLLTRVRNLKAAHIVNRNYYEHEISAAGDPSVVPELSIETLEPAPGPPPRLGDADIARRLRWVATFLKTSTLGLPPPSPKTAPSWFSTTPNLIGEPHTFRDDQGNVGFGALDNTYAAGVYALPAGQALIMEGRMPDCFFANVMLWNRFMQTGNYLHRRVSLNRQQMQLGRGGRYRIVIAGEDPGEPNWIDASGMPSGIVFWRFLLAEGRVERPRARVASIADVRAGR